MKDESLTAQLLNMVLENNALKERVLPYLAAWLIFNVVILFLLLYIAVRITF